jgi:calcineurin-like phosphoesterase family protein
MIYFTADWYLKHKNIIKYCDRPFDNCDQMQQEIIWRYHQTVGHNDEVIFIGDIFWTTKLDYMRSLLTALPGKKYLIRGNHDTATTTKYKKAGFVSVEDSFMVLTYKEHDYHLCHDPALSQMNRNKRYLCGHVHDLFIKQKNVINVGVDVWNWHPVAITDIDALFDVSGFEHSL